MIVYVKYNIIYSKNSLFLFMSKDLGLTTLYFLGHQLFETIFISN